MFKKFLIGFVVLIVLFLGFVVTREGKFLYEKSVIVNAKPDKVFPYINLLKNGSIWNAFDQKDPHVKRTFIGNDGEVGSKMQFEGNSEAGSGYLEILSVRQNEEVQIKLVMTKPVAAENLIVYKLQAEGEGTRFTWSMSGDGGFMGKLINVFIDCEKMIISEFDKSFNNLKIAVEQN